jgi:hypothetical protein
MYFRPSDIETRILTILQTVQIDGIPSPDGGCYAFRQGLDAPFLYALLTGPYSEPALKDERQYFRGYSRALANLRARGLIEARAERHRIGPPRMHLKGTDGATYVVQESQEGQRYEASIWREQHRLWGWGGPAGCSEDVYAITASGLEVLDAMEGGVSEERILKTLTDTERRVLNIIERPPPDQGQTGKEIIAALRKQGYLISQSTLTRHIIPKLKRWYNVENPGGGRGYRIKPS